MVAEFQFINLFRAIASFWVLCAHCMFWADWYHIPLPSAKIAVDLFMIISGFLMAHNAFARNHFEPLTSLRNWLKFYIRRFFRIAPAYYLSLLLVIVTSSYFLAGFHELQNLNLVRNPIGSVYDPTTIEYSLNNILLHITFLFGLHPEYSFSTFLPDWSLSLEMQFYFAFPALILSMHRWGGVRISIYMGLPIFIFGFVLSRYVHYYEPSLLIFKLNYFLVGILLFNTLSVDIKRTQTNKLFDLLCAFLLVSIDIRYGKQLLVLPLLLFSMFLLGWLEERSRTPRIIFILINNCLTKFASNTSYGVYLFHGFFISIFGLMLQIPEIYALTAFQRVLFMLAFVLISSYSAAYLVYKFVELPGISLGKLVIRKLR